MSDSIKDAFAKQAVADLFGSGEDGQRMAEKYQRTGRIESPVDEKEVQTRSVDFRPIKDSCLDDLLHESFEESLESEREKDAERDKMMESFVQEAGDEAEKNLSKILKSLR